MSKKKVGRELITDIIKRVLANRDDIESDDLFIHQVTSNTMKATPVIDILSHMEEIGTINIDSVDDERLAPCIEVLALVNSMIDHQLTERAPN